MLFFIWNREFWVPLEASLLSDSSKMVWDTWCDWCNSWSVVLSTREEKVCLSMFLTLQASTVDECLWIPTWDLKYEGYLSKEVHRNLKNKSRDYICGSSSSEIPVVMGFRDPKLTLPVGNSVLSSSCRVTNPCSKQKYAIALYKSRIKRTGEEELLGTYLSF